MLFFGLFLIAYGLIAIVAAILNTRLAWWAQTRPEFVVRAATALGLGVILAVLGWLAD